MSKILVMLGGIVCLVLGIWGIFVWWSYFIKGLMAIIPPVLIILGVILAIFGYSDLKSSMEEKREKRE
ncbi:MAG: hypothetical protein ACP5K2_02195 [bacterium]